MRGLDKFPVYYAEKYRETFMNMAEEFGSNSKANRLQVGTLIYLNDHTWSGGINGMPSGSYTEWCEDEEGNTKPDVRHSEIAAIDKLYCAGQGDKLEGSILFCTHAPCLVCASEIKSCGIVKVYYKNEYRCRRGVNYLRRHSISVEKLGEQDGR